MNKIQTLSVLIPLMCNPVSAVEMGPVRVKSSLNQPFHAVLSLDDVTALELADIRFSLADHSAYRRFAMQRPDGLDQLKFKVNATGENSFELQISSTQRVVEPILNLLIRVNEHQGDFYRQYTLLIDPPESSQVGVPTASTAISTIDVPQSTSIDGANFTVPAAAARVEPVVEQAPVAPAAAQTLLVKNRSISIIAQNSELHNKYSVYQIMRAFYLANSDAFDRGNIDKLISGSRLVIPDESVIAEVPRQQAVNFVFSVSRDYPRSAVAQQPITPVTESNASAAKPQLAAPQQPAPIPESPQLKVETPLATSRQLDEDVRQWRPVSIEFDQLSSAVQQQNSALSSQLDTVKTLAEDLATHESQILELTLRLNQLQSLVPLVEGDRNAGVLQEQQALIRDQESIIRGQEAKLLAASEQLQQRDTRIIELKNDLQAVRDRAEVVSPAADTSANMQAQPVKVSAPAPIVTHVSEPGLFARWGAWVLLLLMMAVFIAREWAWRRRTAPVEAEPVPAEKPNTYAPSESSKAMDSVEIRHLGESSDKPRPVPKQAGSMQVSQQSNLRLEVTTADAAQIEIEVLLAYEQYNDAMQLLQLSREKFGAADWIDCKTLEILGATNQCEEFLALFNEKRAALEGSAPIAWAKIEKLRDKLCAEFNISALG